MYLSKTKQNEPCLVKIDWVDPEIWLTGYDGRASRTVAVLRLATEAHWYVIRRSFCWYFGYQSRLGLHKQLRRSPPMSGGMAAAVSVPLYLHVSESTRHFGCLKTCSQKVFFEWESRIQIVQKLGGNKVSVMIKATFLIIDYSIIVHEHALVSQAIIE